MIDAEVGKTKDAGFQVGARKTFDVDQSTAWDFMFSGSGLAMWLDGSDKSGFEVGGEFILKNGTKAKITVLKPYSHVRMKLSRDNWETHSRLQVRIMDSGGKTIIAFHQELLDDAEQRAEMKTHWQEVLDRISDKIGK